MTIDSDQGHFAWRSLLNRLQGAERDSTLDELRDMLFADEASEASAGANSANVPDEARQHLMSLLGELNDADASALLLDLALAAPDNSRDR